MFKKIISFVSVIAIIIGIILTIQAISAPTSSLEEFDFGETYSVSRQDVAEKIYATGEVITGKDLVDIKFDQEGIVNSVFVNAGDSIKRGDNILSLEIENLEEQKNQALRDIEKAQSDLDKILSSGTKTEEPNQAAILAAQANLNTIRNIAEANIRLAQNQVNLAQGQFNSANQNLNDLKNQINNLPEIDSINYENVINEVFFALDNAVWFFNEIQDEYFYSNDQTAFKLREREAEALKDFYTAKWYYETYMDEDEPADWLVREMPDKFKESLREMADTYKLLLESFENDPLYQDVLSVENRDEIDETREEINEAQSKTNQLIQGFQSNSVELQALIDSAETRKIETLAFLNDANQHLLNVQEESRNLISQAEEQLRQAYNQIITNFKPADSASVETAKQALVEANNRYTQLLSKTNTQILTSPIDGIVSEVNVSSGDRINKDSVVMKIDAQESLEISTLLETVDLIKIDLFDEVKIKSEEYPGKTWQGVVSNIENGETFISFDNCSVDEISCLTKLAKGNSVDLEISIREKKNALVVPKEFLIQEEDKNFVKLEKDQEDILQEVKLGIINGEFVEILDGVEENDVILLP